MATKPKWPEDGTLPTMKQVLEWAYELRGLLTDTDWETEGEEIRSRLVQLDEAIALLPFASGKRKPSLEYKLARAAAEKVHPHRRALQAFLRDHRARCLGWDVDKVEAERLSDNLTDALGVFAALAEGL